MLCSLQFMLELYAQQFMFILFISRAQWITVLENFIVSFILDVLDIDSIVINSQNDNIFCLLIPEYKDQQEGLVCEISPVADHY